MRACFEKPSPVPWGPGDFPGQQLQSEPSCVHFQYQFSSLLLAAVTMRVAESLRWGGPSPNLVPHLTQAFLGSWQKTSQVVLQQ